MIFDILNTIPLDVRAGLIGAIAGVLIGILLACALALLVSTHRRERIAMPTLERRMKQTYPQAYKK